MKKLYKFMIATGIIISLSACGKTTEELIHNQLEEAYKAEKSFYATQSEMAKLEASEKALFNQIIKKDVSEFNEIEKIQKQAQVNINERREKLTIEKEGMDESKKTFQKVKDSIADLEDKNIQKKAETMYNTMSKRYELHDQLTNLYLDTLSKEEELYNLLANKKTEHKEVSKQIEQLNKKYDELLQINDFFNEETEKYNKNKKAFYDTTNLEIAYEE